MALVAERQPFVINQCHGCVFFVHVAAQACHECCFKEDLCLLSRLFVAFTSLLDYGRACKLFGGWVPVTQRIEF